MKYFPLLIAVCLTSCVTTNTTDAGTPTPAAQVLTCATPILDAAYAALKADVEKALQKQTADWAGDLEKLVDQKGLQTIVCIVDVIMSQPKPVIGEGIVGAGTVGDVSTHAKDFLAKHNVTVKH